MLGTFKYQGTTCTDHEFLCPFLERSTTQPMERRADEGEEMIAAGGKAVQRWFVDVQSVQNPGVTG